MQVLHTFSRNFFRTRVYFPLICPRNMVLDQSLVFQVAFVRIVLFFVLVSSNCQDASLIILYLTSYLALDCFFHKSLSLAVCNRELYSNNITGPIPSDLGNLTSLVSLDLYLNSFTGPIPDTLGKLSKLRFL